MANLVSIWINSSNVCPVGYFEAMFIVNFFRVTPVGGNPSDSRGNWLVDAAYLCFFSVYSHETLSWVSLLGVFMQDGEKSAPLVL